MIQNGKLMRAVTHVFVNDPTRGYGILIKNMLSDNWKGHEVLRAEIMKKGHFFGNDDDTSNSVARLFYDGLYHYVKNKKTVYGYPCS